MRNAEMWVDHMSTNDIRDSPTTLVANIAASQPIPLILLYQTYIDILQLLVFMI